MIQRILTKWIPKFGKTSSNQAYLSARNSSKRSLAATGELFAKNYLSKRGWEILEENWRAGRRSEIDIIALDTDGTLVFVEVKARKLSSSEAGFVNHGFDSINWHKQRKILLGAAHYLAKHQIPDRLYRFDAIVLYYQCKQDTCDKNGLPYPQVNHVANIF